MRSLYKTIKEQNNEFNQFTKNDDHYTSIDDRVSLLFNLYLYF